MKGFLSIRLDELLEYLENDTFRYEVSRIFRHLVGGSSFTALAPKTMADFLHRGEHRLDVVDGKFPRFLAGAIVASEHTAPGVTMTAEPFRFRLRGIATVDAPSAPNQKAFAINRAGVAFDGAAGPTRLSPGSHLSSRDIGFRQIGHVYKHPAGRRAFFDELGQVATGVGLINTGGSFSPSVSEEVPYLYDIRIETSGGESAAEYVFRKRPYFLGAFEQGAGISDAYISSGSDTLSSRIATSGWNRANLDLRQLGLNADTSAEVPSSVAYDDSYPTAAADSNSLSPSTSGFVFDGLEDGRLWWSVCDTLAVNDANASSSRSLWTWKRWSPQAFVRADTVLSGFPSLGASVQFRDLKAGRGGLLYLACDGDDDDGNGSDVGALLVIDAASDTVLNVLGSAAAGIYTDGGMAENNALAVCVDTTESYASAGFDRVWTLSRVGLTYFDVNISTGAIGARTTITGAPITGSSLRGLGGFAFLLTPRNGHPGLIDFDGAGDVYWVSAPGGGGIHRLNKITGDGVTFTFLSLDTSAEGGGAGFIDIGTDVTGAVGREICSLRVHRRDVGDPADDDIWISSGHSTNGAGVYPVARLSLTVHAAGGDVMANGSTDKFEGTQFSSSGTGAYLLHVSPDGSAVVSSPGNNIAVLEGLGRVNSGQDFDNSFSVSAPLRQMGANAFPDESGVFFSFAPWASVSAGAHMAHFMMPVHYQWDGTGMQWYRSRYAVIAGTATKTAHTAQEALADGITVAFDDNGGGPNIFVQDEFHTFSGAPGLVKDTTQDVTIDYDLYTERADLFFGETPKTADAHTIVAGITVDSDLTANPLGAQTEHGIFQRRLFLDGTNGMPDERVTNTGGDPVQYGIDLGSDVTVSQLRFVFEGGTEWSNLSSIALYSASSGDGPTTWTLRYTYTPTADHPDWSIESDAHHEDATVTKTLASTGASGALSWEIDLAEMASQARILNGVDLTKRYWKVVITSASAGQQFVPAGIAVFDGSALVIGTPSDCYLSKSIESSYLANYVVRASWVVDSGTASAARGPSDNQVTLTADTFDLPASGAGNGGSDNITAPVANEQTMTVDDGAFTTAMIGRDIVVAGASNSTNNGVFPVTAVPGATQVTYTNAAGVVESNFAGTYSIDGVEVNDFFRAKIVGTVDDFTAPVQNIQVVTDASALFVPEDKGRVFRTSGASNSENDGAFLIVRVVSTSEIHIRNEGGVVEGSSTASWRIDRESSISSVDTDAQLTFSADAQAFSAVDWEVVRNAEVRPRNDEGGGEDQARIPATPSEVFICPVTGHIVFHQTDIDRGRVLNIDRYTHVRRGL